MYGVSELLLLINKWTIFQLYQGQNKLHSIRWWWRLLCTWPTC